HVNGAIPSHLLGQVMPLEVFHHEIAGPIFELTVKKDSRRVRMAEVAHRPRLTAKARDQIGTAEVLRVEDLDRGRAVHHWPLGTIHRAHSARADALDDPKLIGDLPAYIARWHAREHSSSREKSTD